MKKQIYFDMGLELGLSQKQVEEVLASMLKVSQTQLFTLQDISSSYIYEVQKTFFAIKSGIPSEYTLQKANFYGRDFFVDQRVLIPRNDTEVLVREAVKYIHLHMNLENTCYIDIGTGSACIPVTLLLEISPLKFHKNFVCDISSGALDVARKNIDTYLAGKIEILESNLLESFFARDDLEGKNLCITANLPYIKNGDVGNMDRSVIQHEPHTALFGGEKTGFELYEKLLKQCFQLKHIQKLGDIHLFIEIGFDQYEYSQSYLRDFGLSFEYFTDSASIYRAIHITGF